MGQLNDIELCNNVIFILHKTPECIISASQDPFWCGLGEFMIGGYEAALEQMGNIQKDDPTYLGGLAIQTQIHKTSNKDKAKKMDTELKESRNSASSIELEFCAVAYYVIGKVPKATEYLDKCLRKHGNDVRTICLRGAFESNPQKADSYFSQLSEDDDIFSAIGKYYQLQSFLRARQHASVLKELEALIQINPNFIAGRILMCQTAFGIQEWDVLFENASWLISVCPSFYDAHLYVIVEALLSGENEAQCHDRLSYFNSVLEKSEKRNIIRGVNYCRMLIGLVGDDKKIAPLIFELLKLCPETSETHYLSGRLHFLQNDIQKAQASYNMCMSLDSSMIEAFCGLVWCLIRENNQRHAAQQLEMAKSLMGTTVSAEIYLLEVLLDSGDKLDLLKKAFNEQTKKLMHAIPDLTLIENLNPIFCLEIIEQYVALIDPAEVNSGGRLSSSVRRTDRLISVLRRSCANLKSVRIIEARLKILSNNLEEAEEILNQLHQFNPDSVQVYILFSELELKRKNTLVATKYIDQAVAIKFEIQNTSQYQLIRGRIEALCSNFGAAIHFFEHAIKLNELKSNDVIAANIELSEAYRKNGQLDEATNVTSEIEKKYSNTSSIAGKLALSKAERFLQNSDVSSAIKVLEEISYESASAISSKKRLAEIYLIERRNEEKFLEIYREICQCRPGEADPLISLGDALIRVNRPEDSIKSYEAALRLSGSDPKLQIKIGKALVITHDYSGAIKYYKKSLKRGENSALRIELADLLRKLQRYDEAENILIEGTEHSTNDYSDLNEEANCSFELCKMKSARGDKDGALQLLARAKAACDQLLKKEHNDNNLVDSAKGMAADIHGMIAELAAQSNDLENAVKFYGKAASFLPNTKKANLYRLKLAAVYRDKGDITAAQGVLSKLVNSDAASEALEMNAGLMCDQGNTDGAIQYFLRIIEKQPNKWDQFSQLITLLYRNGKLSDAEIMMQDMDQQELPGRRYCLALIDYYKLETESAMDHLIISKRSKKWKIQSIRLIIHICLGMDSDEINNDPEAIELASQLLCELPEDDINTKIIQNWILLAQKDTNSVNAAIEGFQSFSDLRLEASLTGICAGFIILKKPQAKNQLKRLSSSQWNSFNFEHLEKGHLILAGLHLQNNKASLAREACDTILMHNKSSWRALELKGMAYVLEKDSTNSIQCFTEAWKASYGNNPAIGYRLSQALLNNKKPLEAIEICHKVLRVNPNYPRIREQIINPARKQIRL